MTDKWVDPNIVNSHRTKKQSTHKGILLSPFDSDKHLACHYLRVNSRGNPS